MLSAFLNADLEENVYVTQPEGFIIQGKEENVYKLKKVLYGLKQSLGAQYSKIGTFLRQNGSERSENELTFYVKKHGKSILIVCLYVDYINHMSSSFFLIDEFKAYMKNKFEMTNLGLLHYFLCLEVNQVEDGLLVSQRKYATDLLKIINMLNCKVAATPLNLNEKLQQEDETEQANSSYFRGLVGGLLYLTHTRLDIAFSFGVISKFMHCLLQLGLEAAKRILRQIAGTVDFGLWHCNVSNFKLCGFTDSDGVGFLEDRMSTFDYIFNLGS